MKNVLTTIHDRVSVRTYQARKPDQAARKDLGDFMRALTRGPFGNPLRFQFVEVADGDLGGLKELGTYGMIRGAHLYIAGAVKRGDKDMEDFGYCMESVLLKATELGLGTVWLAGFLNRSAFGEKIALGEDEALPAVSPVGYAAENRPLREKLIRGVLRASSRRDFDALFFEGRPGNPVNKPALGPYLEVLEAVRLAPSASNKQPWRIVKETGSNTFHLYLSEDEAYNRSIRNIRVQNLDMGIALCHFDLASRDLGLKGEWVEAKPGLDAGDLVYIASFREKM
jgi:nitroreductase